MSPTITLEELFPFFSPSTKDEIATFLAVFTFEGSESDWSPEDDIVTNIDGNYRHTIKLEDYLATRAKLREGGFNV